MQWGLTGLSVAWIAAYPLHLMICARRSLPVIGVRARDLASAAAIPVIAAAGMAIAVWLLDQVLPALGPLPRVAALIATGALVYGGWLMIFARATVIETIDLIRNRG